MSSIAQSWQRISAWYAQNTPKDTLVLADGASEAEMVELEAALGQRLPDDVRESLALHNGAANEAYLLYFGELLSTQRMLEVWQMYADMQKSEGWGLGPD